MDVRGVLREHSPLIAVTTAYVTAATMAEWTSGVAIVSRIRVESLDLVFLFALCALASLVLHAIYQAFRVGRDQSLFRAIATRFGESYLRTPSLLSFAVCFITFDVLLSFFTSFKGAIPKINMFTWDYSFAVWDRTLHGGRDPWRILQPLLGCPWITCLFNFFYNIWFFIMMAVVYWQAWSRDRPLRMRFLLSFFAAWMLLGTALATALSSAGPCYYGRVTGLPDPYAPLMAYLRHTNGRYPVWSLAVQEHLWDAYQSDGSTIISGISAMPSLHVATSVLFALLGWQVNRYLGIALTLFALIIQVGSVHLGWHYAIDGYVSTILTILIWQAAGLWVRRFGPRAMPDAMSAVPPGEPRR